LTAVRTSSYRSSYHEGSVGLTRAEPAVGPLQATTHAPMFVSQMAD